MTNHGFVKGTNIEIIELNGKRYAMNGWNGEKYFDCYEVDECGYAIDPKAAPIEMRPEYKEVGEDEFEITGYTIG